MQRGLIWEVIKEFSNSSNEITEIKYFDGYYYNLHQMCSDMFVLRLKRNYIGRMIFHCRNHYIYIPLYVIS